MAASKTLTTTPWRYQARRPAVAGSFEFTTAGVRTFLPPASLSKNGPAITRLTRYQHYNSKSRVLALAHDRLWLPARPFSQENTGTEAMRTPPKARAEATATSARAN